MFGFKKKKKRVQKAESEESTGKSRYQEELASVVGKKAAKSNSGVDDNELAELTSGLDDEVGKNPDTMTFDESEIDDPSNQVVEDDLLDDDLDDLLGDDDDDLGLTDDDLEEVPVEEQPHDNTKSPKASRKPSLHHDKSKPSIPNTDPSTILKQKPVKVVDDESARLRKLQEENLDEAEDIDMDGITTQDAISLVSQLSEEEEPETIEDTPEIDEDLNLDDDLDEELPAEEDLDTEFDDDDDLFEDEDDDLIEEQPDEEDELIEDEEPEPEPQIAVQKEITQEEAFKALPPVQQAILRQMKNIDTTTLQTQAQMTQENLYMQSQIVEWSNAYSLQMKHLNQWEEYANKLRDLLISQNDEYEEEKQHLIHRHQIQMRNLRASLEADYVEREEKIIHDQRIARDMVEQASKLLAQAKQHDSASKDTIDGLRRQIEVMSTRPSVLTETPIPVAPDDSSEDIFAGLGLKHPSLNQDVEDDDTKVSNNASTSQSEDSDDIGDLFDENNW